MTSVPSTERRRRSSTGLLLPVNRTAGLQVICVQTLERDLNDRHTGIRSGKGRDTESKEDTRSSCQSEVKGRGEVRLGQDEQSECASHQMIADKTGD